MSFLVGLGGGVGLGTLLGTQSLTNALNYSVNSSFPNTIIGANDIIDLVRRGYVSKTLYYSLMRHLGYDENYSKLLYAGSDSLLTPEQCNLYRIDRDLNLEYAYENGTLTLPQLQTARTNNVNLFYDLMKRQGYRLNEAQRSFIANRPVPTFSEILNWMAKEVFEPRARQLFRLDEEEPPQLKIYMEKYGVPKEEAQKYWIAHWNTIGFGQWRELYNRFNDRRSEDHVNAQLAEYKKPDGTALTFNDVKITDEEYNAYFTVLEQTPYFRDRLRGATSEPINFTTLQDLFRYGILNPDQLKEFLRDYNWSDYNASLIVDAWKRKFPYGDRLPLYDNILYQFDKGLLDRDQAEQELLARDVDQETIDFQLDRISDKREERRVEFKVKALAIKYGRRDITDAELRAEINKITDDNERREYVELEIKLASERYIVRPSTRQIGRGYQNNKLTEQEFRTILISYRMDIVDIEVMLKLFAPEQ